MRAVRLQDVLEVLHATRFSCRRGSSSGGRGRGSRWRLMNCPLGQNRRQQLVFRILTEAVVDSRESLSTSYWHTCRFDDRVKERGESRVHTLSHQRWGGCELCQRLQPRRHALHARLNVGPRIWTHHDGYSALNEGGPRKSEKLHVNGATGKRRQTSEVAQGWGARGERRHGVRARRGLRVTGNRRRSGTETPSITRH